MSNTVIDLLEKGFNNIKYEYKTDITIDGGKVIGTNIQANEKAKIYDEIIVYINDFKYSALTDSSTVVSSTEGQQVTVVPQTSQASDSTQVVTSEVSQ